MRKILVGEYTFICMYHYRFINVIIQIKLLKYGIRDPAYLECGEKFGYMNLEAKIKP